MSLLFLFLFFSPLVFCELEELRGGNGFIEIGNFRIGVSRDVGHFSHFSISSKTNTIIIFRSDGTVHPGPRTDFGLWHKNQEKVNANGESGEATPSNVEITKNGIIFDDRWCIGATGIALGFQHLSIAYKGGATAMIWRSDGTRHPGPRNDWSCWKKEYQNNIIVGTDKKNRKFVQWNDMFRLGDTGMASGFEHLSLASVRTIVIYRSDGTIHPGPRDDWSWPPFEEYRCVENQNFLPLLLNSNSEIFSLDNNNNYNNLIIGGLIFIILSIGICYYYYYFNKKRQETSLTFEEF